MDAGLSGDSIASGWINRHNLEASHPVCNGYAGFDGELSQLLINQRPQGVDFFCPLGTTVPSDVIFFYSTEQQGCPSGKSFIDRS